MRFPVGRPARGGMGVEAFVGLLDNVKKHHDGWIAYCPACGHTDKRPTLVVNERDHRILLHCYRGCAALDVVGALGLTLADLFNDREPTDPIARREWDRVNLMSRGMAAMNHMLNVTDRMQVEMAANPSGKRRAVLQARYSEVLAQTLADVGGLK